MKSVIIKMEVPDNFYEILLPYAEKENLSANGNIVLPMKVDTDQKSALVFSCIAVYNTDKAIQQMFEDRKREFVNPENETVNE
jgi:hypothetical protein